MPTRASHHAGRGRAVGERGAAMVEFALIVPVLLALVFGIYQFGRGYNAKVELTGAVREGARAVALTSPANASSAATAAVTGGAPGLTAGSIAVTVVSSCPVPAPAGANAVVRANYPMTYSIPPFFSGTWDIEVESVMRCGV